MVTTLSELVKKTQGGAIPAWLRDAVLEKKNEIAKELRENGKCVLQGQNGEQVTIYFEKARVRGLPTSGLTLND